MKIEILKRYAAFLIENHLDELIRTNIQRAREVNIPLLALFKNFSEEELFAFSKQSFRTFIENIVSGEVLNAAEIDNIKWKENKIEIAPRDRVEVKDVVLSPHIRKYALLKFIPRFTSDLTTFQELVLEIEELFTSIQEISFNAFVEVQRNLIQQQNEELEHDKRMLHGLLQNIPIIVTHINKDGNTLESVGKGLRAIGLKDNQLKGKNIFELDPAVNVKEALQTQTAKVFEGKSGLNEDTRYYINYFFPDNAEGLIGFSLDITDQKKAEYLLQKKNEELSTAFEELRSTEEYLQRLNIELESKVAARTAELQKREEELQTSLHKEVDLNRKLSSSESQLRTLIDSLPMLIAYIDNNQKYQLVNKQYEEWFGFPVEKYVGQTVEDVTGHEAYPSLKNFISRTLAGEHVYYETKIKYQTKGEVYISGTYVPYFEGGKVVGFYAVIRDITNKKLLEEEIRSQREQLNQIFLHAPALIALLNGRNLTYILANPPYLKLFDKNVLGKTMAEAHPEVEQQGVIEILKKVYASGQPYIAREMRLDLDVNHSGNLVPFYFNFVYQPILNTKSEVDSILVFAVDSTSEIKSRKKIETLAKELAEAYAISEKRNAELVRLNQVLDNFVYSAAHDLRAPVSNIKALSNLFTPESPKVSKEKFLKEVNFSLDRLDNTITGLVEVIEIQNNTGQIVKNIKFQGILDTIMREFESEIDESDAVIHSDFKNVPSVFYLEVYLESVVRNLLSNAIKYRSDQPLTISFTSAKQDGFVLLSVSDNGIGMELEKYGKNLFKPFTRFTKKASGKGIGLHLIKNMVERNGGRIEAVSTLNSGTTFNVFLKEYK